jgi:S1-C subfamily serine protease
MLLGEAFAMKRTLLWCALSAAVGGILAVALYERPVAESTTVAQEPAPLRPPHSSLPVGIQAPPVAPALGQPALPALADELTPEERVNVAVYQNVNRSVVNINTKSMQGERFLFFDIESEGEGSGSILDRQGHVLTNFHVIDGARQIRVTLFDGKTYDARLFGVDPPTDVAVLKIDAPVESLYPVTFGNSAQLLVGQRVYAIGNPFGLERTLSTGIIASLDRELPARRTSRSIKSVIQIDAAINPGNSGGPLLDTHSRIIGMNTAIASKTGECAGVGFAIPINTIARVVPQLIQNGRVRRPESGIARVFQTERGLLIHSLVPGGAAEKAGMRGPKVTQKRPFIYVDRSAADLIVAVDGQPVKTGDDFLSAIEAKQPGEEVRVTVIRDGKELQIPLRLEPGE